MARSDFAGSSADFVFSTYTLGSSSLLKLASATLYAWDAETGGNQVTDLLVDGAAATSVPVGADGQIPTFQGPDGVTTLWLSAGLSGERFRFVNSPDDIDSAMASAIDTPGSEVATVLSASIAAEVGTEGTETRILLNAAFAEKVAPARSLVSKGIETTTGGALVFIDDDGKGATYSVTRDIFNTKGQPFVAAVTTSLLDTVGYMTLAQVQQIQADGHEIASHLVVHNGVGAGFDYSDIGESRDWLRGNGLDVDHLVWVGGAYNTDAITEAKRHYTSATSVERGRNVPPVNQFAIRRYAVGSMWSNSTSDGILEDGSQAQYNAMVDMAKNNNALVVAMMHNWEPAFDATQRTRLEAMIDYAATSGVPILTMREALERFGNALDLGDDTTHVRVGADGLQSFKDARGRLAYRDLGVNPAGIDNTTAGTAYNKGVVSVATFTLPSSSGFPTSHAGTLVHYYLNDQYTIHQLWYPYGVEGEAWFRAWNGASSSWRTWKTVAWQPTPSVSLSVTSQTIAAGGIAEVRIMHPAAASINGTTDTVMASPVGGLEAGVMHSVAMWTDKTVVIRLHNTTAASITTADRNWRVSILD